MNQPNQTINQSIVEKIQKCLALGQSPNENEARLAMARANELLVKYNLSILDVVENKEETTDKVIFQHSYTETWRSVLVNNVAKHNLCMLLLCKSYKGVEYKIIGKPVNIKTTEWMLTYFFEVIERITKKECKSGSREAFKYGMVKGLSEKLEEIRRQEQTSMHNSENTTALVVTKMYETARKENNSYIARNIGRTTTTSTSGYSDGRNIASGREHGRNVNINSQIGR